MQFGAVIRLVLLSSCYSTIRAGICHMVPFTFRKVCVCRGTEKL